MRVVDNVELNKQAEIIKNKVLFFFNFKTNIENKLQEEYKNRLQS